MLEALDRSTLSLLLAPFSRTVLHRTHACQLATSRGPFSLHFDGGRSHASLLSLWLSPFTAKIGLLISIHNPYPYF